MDKYDDYMSEALKAAKAGDTRRMMTYANLVPPSWDVWQQLPSAAKGDGNGPGLPDDAVDQILAHLSSHPRRAEELLPSFLFEMASNLPPNIGSEALNQIAELGKEDGYVTEHVKGHPNYRPDAQMQSLQEVAKFWHDYEGTVKGDHFATIRSLYTNHPEEFNDHRGNAGTSKTYEHLLPHFPEYAKAAQLAVAKTAAEDKANGYKDSRDDSDKMLDIGYPPLHLRWFAGKPHIKVYRGVGGNFGESIRRAIRLNEATGEADNKKLVLPHPGYFSSWTAAKGMAVRFAHRRGEIDDQPKRKGMVIEKWMPLQNLLHSGFHTLVFDQDHAHKHENELVFGHPDGNLRIATKDLHYVIPDSEWEAHSEPVVVRQHSLQKSERSLVLRPSAATPEERRLAVVLAEMNMK